MAMWLGDGMHGMVTRIARGRGHCISLPEGAEWRPETEVSPVRLLSLLLTLVLALFLTGCGELLSTEPLASSNDTTFDAGLLGTWSNQEDTVFTVTSHAPPDYEILLVGTDKGEKTSMRGRLARLGEHRILDLTDAEPGMYSIQGHIWVHVEKKGATLQIQYLDSKWLQDKLRQSGLPWFIADSHPVITAPTAKLQEFARQYAVQPEARGNTLELVPFKKKAGK
jgi:hypothetical protein